MLAKNICLALLGFSAGITAAGGLFSFIIGLGVISDFADRTHTGEQVMLYEDAVAAGGSLRRYFCVSSGGSVRRLSASGHGTVRRNLCGLLGNGFDGNAGSVSDLYQENPYGKRDCSGDDWNRIWKRSGRIIVFLEEVVMIWRRKNNNSHMKIMSGRKHRCIICR